MFKKLKSFFEKDIEVEDLQPDINKAVAFILLEVACADHQLKEDELKQIKSHLSLQKIAEPDDVDQFLKKLIAEHDWILSIQPHTRLINEQFSAPQKVDLLEQCWRIAFADNELDKHEEHRIRKLSELLYCSHKDFIQTKLKVTGHHEH